MNLKRILTGLIGFPIVALILVYGNKYIIDVLFAIVAEISIYEYFHTISKYYKPVQYLGYFVALLIAFIHIIPIDILTKIITMIIPTSIVLLFLQVIATSMKTKPQDAFATLFGVLYVVGFIVFLPMLYGTQNGKVLIWYLIFAAWGTDTFAYAIGRRFGKHRLTSISPKKSIEGSIAGTIGSVIVALIFTYIIKNNMDFDISYILVGITAFILSILSQIGDLAASSIKREMEVKDYGNLLPGHGGMLDRIDSLIFIAPFAYFLFVLI